MNQHLHLVTLGVKDFQTSRRFYTETLGWQPSGSNNDGITFFQVGGVVFSFYQREKLAEDALVDPEGTGFAGFTLAYNAQSESEVDEIIRDLKSNDVKILKEPQKVFWTGIARISRTLMAIAGKWLTIRFSPLMRMAI